MKIRKFGWKESKIQKLKNLEIFLKIEKLKRCYFVYFEFENSRIFENLKNSWKSRNIRSRKFQKSKIKKIIFDRINIRQSEIVVCIKSFPPLHASLYPCHFIQTYRWQRWITLSARFINPRWNVSYRRYLNWTVTCAQ